MIYRSTKLVVTKCNGGILKTLYCFFVLFFSHECSRITTDLVVYFHLTYWHAWNGWLKAAANLQLPTQTSQARVLSSETYLTDVACCYFLFRRTGLYHRWRHKMQRKWNYTTTRIVERIFCCTMWQTLACMIPCGAASRSWRRAPTMHRQRRWCAPRAGKREPPAHGGLGEYKTSSLW